MQKLKFCICKCISPSMCNWVLINRVQVQFTYQKIHLLKLYNSRIVGSFRTFPAPQRGPSRLFVWVYFPPVSQDALEAAFSWSLSFSPSTLRKKSQERIFEPSPGGTMENRTAATSFFQETAVL